MADNEALEKEQTPGQLERDLPRIRYLPDWEIPVSPPKRQRSLFSRAKISRSIRRSRLAAVFRPKPTFVAASRPTSDTSIQNTKESFVDTRGIHGGISSLSRSSTAPELPPSPLHRIVHTLPPRRYLGGLTRLRIVLTAVAILLALGLSLGLGIGLGLRHGVKATNLQPAGLQPANLPPPTAPSPASPPPAAPSPAAPLPSAFSAAAAVPAASPSPATPSPIPSPAAPSPNRPSPTPHIYQGNLTSFSPGHGECGCTYPDSAPVCAIPHEIFDAAAQRLSIGINLKPNPLCERRIRVTAFVAAAGNTRKQVSVDVRVANRCAKCGPEDLELSPGAFGQIAGRGRGVVVGTWQFV